jgi:hypothetical protein
VSSLLLPLGKSQRADRKRASRFDRRLSGRHHPGTAGEIISERRATSNRIEQHHPGFVGDFPRNQLSAVEEAGYPTERQRFAASAIRSMGDHWLAQLAWEPSMPAMKKSSGALCFYCLYAFQRSICCRARKTVRSPAAISDDMVHSRKATFRGSMRSADQKVSSPIRCCLA